MRPLDEMDEGTECVCQQWATTASAEEGSSVEKDSEDKDAQTANE